MSKATKTSKARSSKAVLKVQGVPALRTIAKAAATVSDNVRTQFCLDMAASIAKDNGKVPAKSFRAFKTAIVKVLREDKAISTAGAQVFTSANNWRRYANLTALAALAMVRYPKRKFTALQTSKAASLNSKAASTVGQLILDADGKKDARGKNSKGRATRAPGKAAAPAKVSDPAAAEHPEANSGKLVTMRRFGSALGKHCTDLGSMAALLADDNPDPAAVIKAARALIKSGSTAAKEFDRSVLNGGIEPGTNTKFASLI